MRKRKDLTPITEQIFRETSQALGARRMRCIGKTIHPNATS